MSEVFDDYCDHEPIIAILYSIGFYLPVCVPFPLPITTEQEITTKPGTSEFRLKLLPGLDRHSDFIFSSPTLLQSCRGVRV